jgi:superfamily II DNA or RNA helicase
MALVQARKGHKVLVIADRVDFLQRVTKLLGDKAVCVVGETDDRQAEIAKVENGTADIICGSRQIFSEGISVNCLSCVILAVPIANAPTLEQIIGRIMRLFPGKLDPIVLDIQFNGPSEKRQNDLRIALYLEKGWKMLTL